ncbi:hypothetical protein [Streptomyces sp. NPDC093089]|uniref:hypothetical protein n=1 Tax=Streptomyces sp. NPDC093089 TaxID=3366024 RepID=UPI00381036C3
MAAACLDLTRSLRRRGAIVLAAFALVWALAGGSGTPAALPVGVVAALVSAGAVVVAFRGTAGPVRRTVRLPEKWNRGSVWSTRPKWSRSSR